MFWDENLERIKKIYEPYAALVESQEFREKPYRVERLTHDFPDAYVIGEGYQCFLHSVYNPEFEALFMIEKAKSLETIFLFGGGFFYHVEKLREAYPNKVLIVIEPDIQIFKMAMESRSLKILEDPSVVLFLTDSSLQIAQSAFQMMKSIGFKKFDIIPLMSYKIFAGQIYAQLYEDFGKQFHLAAANLNTELFFLKNWVSNEIKNYKRIIAEHQPMLNRIFGKTIKVPAVVVGAGPSIDKNIDVLKKYRNRVLVIGAGSGINILKKNGIVPDLAVIVDGSIQEDKIVEAVPEESVLCYHTTATASGIANSSAFKTYFIGSDDRFFPVSKEPIMKEIQPVLMGGSCVNSAADIAAKLGCETVIFVGQDMAYTDKQLYGDGAAFKDLIERDTREKVIKEDIFGNPIETNHSFLSIRMALNMYTRNYDDIRFINATEGGLGIEGVPNETLESVLSILEDPGIDFSALIKNALNTLPERELVFQTEAAFDAYLEEIKEIKVLSEERLLKIAKLLNRIDEMKDKVIKRRLDEILKITKTLDDFELNDSLFSKSLQEFDTALRHQANSSLDSYKTVKEKYTMLARNLSNYYEKYHYLVLVAEENFKGGKDHAGEN